MTTKNKKYTAIAIVVALLAVVGLVYRQVTVEKKEKPIVWVHENGGHPFYALISLGFLDACDDLGVYCKEYSTNEKGIEAKLNQCDIMLADTGTRGAVFVIHDDSMSSCLEQLDVPWVNTNGRYNEDPNFLARIGPDVEANSVMAAHAMAEAVGGKGEIIVTQCKYNELENLGAQAFIKTIEDYYEDMETTEPTALGPERLDQLAVASALLIQYPDAVGAFGATSLAAATWTAAAQDAGLDPGDLIIIGQDTSQENLDLVTSGWTYAVIAQPTYEQTYQAVVTLVAYLEGEEVEADQFLSGTLITTENVDEYYKLADRVEGFLEERR